MMEVRIQIRSKPGERLRPHLLTSLSVATYSPGVELELGFLDDEVLAYLSPRGKRVQVVAEWKHDGTTTTMRGPMRVIGIIPSNVGTHHVSLFARHGDLKMTYPWSKP